MYSLLHVFSLLQRFYKIIFSNTVSTFFLTTDILILYHIMSPDTT